MRSFFFVIPFLISSLSFAQSFYPPGTLMAFEGQDSTSRERCHLFVTGVQQNSQGVQALQVVTGYAHDHDRPTPMTIQAQRADLFAGVAANGKDQLGLFLGRPGDVRSAKSFNLKWWHVNHFHTFQCLNLRLLNF